MKTIIKISALFILLFSIVNCNKDETVIVEPDPVQEEPTGEQEEPDEQGESGEEVSLESIFPLEGPKETVVTVTGNNFGTDVDAVSIFINGKEMSILSIDDSEIQFEVVPKTFTGEVELRFGTQSFFPGTFDYEVTATVSTLAGASQGNSDGFGGNAKFHSPIGLALDATGNLYVSDSQNHRIRTIAPDGLVSTFAGSEQGFDNGTIANATFDRPGGLHMDTLGSLYVADMGNKAIRKIDSNGNVFIAAREFTNADGSTLQLNNLQDYAIDSKGNRYISDIGHDKIFKIAPDGSWTTIGTTEGDMDGAADMAKFNAPYGLAVGVDDTIYVVDSGNHKIKKINPDGSVHTVAGSIAGIVDGPALEAQFTYPEGIVIDSHNNIYVSDTGGFRIRMISGHDSIVSTLAGGGPGNTDGPGAEAQFSFPRDIVIDSTETILYASDYGNNRIRKIVLE